MAKPNLLSVLSTEPNQDIFVPKADGRMALLHAWIINRIVFQPWQMDNIFQHTCLREQNDKAALGFPLWAQHGEVSFGEFNSQNSQANITKDHTVWWSLGVSSRKKCFRALTMRHRLGWDCDTLAMIPMREDAGPHQKYNINNYGNPLSPTLPVVLVNTDRRMSSEIPWDFGIYPLKMLGAETYLFQPGLHRFG